MIKAFTFYLSQTWRNVFIIFNVIRANLWATWSLYNHILKKKPARNNLQSYEWFVESSEEGITRRTHANPEAINNFSHSTSIFVSFYV